MKTSYTFKDNDERLIEKFVGIESYRSNDIEGIGGIYKHYYKDFIVKEITDSGKILEVKEDFPKSDFFRENGDKFTTFNFVKINKEPFEALRQLGSALNIPRQSIHYCGLKDKTSISVQKVSVTGNFVKKLSKLNIRDYFFRCIKPTRKPVKLGGHWGNNFIIVIRNIENRDNLESDIQKSIKKIGECGFPNYFGLQRFGTYRPNSHLIGRFLLEEKYKHAYHEIATTTYSSEHPKVIKVREALRETGDLEEAYNTFPKSLYYERKIIKYLKENPEDFEGAIKTLSPDLKTLLINAFQSYIFNKLVSFRLNKSSSLLEGDSIGILDDINGHITKVKYIYGGRYDKYLDEAMDLNRAAIVLPLIGYDTELSDFPFIGPALKEIFSEEEIDFKLFKKEAMKNTELKGSLRSLIVKPIGLELLKFSDDDAFPGKKKVKIEFSLPKGSYATMLIRELIK